MRTWSVIYNMFGALILLFMVAILHNDIRANEKQFAEIRLQHVMDYATEAAFLSVLEGGNLGISYQDLQNLKVNPSNVLDAFKEVVALSYNIAITPDNMNMLDQYISTAVLAVSDGYYIASIEEVDTGKLAPIRGGEYQLRWGLKKPYAIGYTSNIPSDVANATPDKFVAYNLSTEQWVLAREVGSTLDLSRGEKYSELMSRYYIAPNKKDILARINRMITNDINLNIQKRNEAYAKGDAVDFVYLPSQTTLSGVNAITKPAVFITLSGVDFAGTAKLESKSVGGFTVGKKRRVLAFTKAGVKYYAYESQIPTYDLGLVEEFYNTVDEAAEAGYLPHVDYLKNPLKD